jgi:UDP-glucuronate 4-epimerase
VRQRFFITGTAGFIGFHLARRLLSEGHEVAGFDALTPYYDEGLKAARRAALSGMPGFMETIGRLEDRDALFRAVEAAEPDIIVHLAAQAGVRAGTAALSVYVDSNVTGSFNLLEIASRLKPRHLLLASTSSVYGGDGLPFRETASANHPLSVYAATKKAMEALAHAESHLHGVPTTCFRFFTVYGPWGRPDMALFRFTSQILAGEPITLYGQGEMSRDLTYVDDLIEAIASLCAHPPESGAGVAGLDSLSPVAPWRAVNIGSGRAVALRELVAAIEEATGRKAERVLLPMQPGDVRETHADTALLSALIGTRAPTPLAQGVAAFVAWYRGHYGV